MGKRKGRNCYIPHSVIDEATSIRKEKGIKTQAGALKLMVNYSRVGREIEYISKLKWPKRVKK